MEIHTKITKTWFQRRDFAQIAKCSNTKKTKKKDEAFNSVPHVRTERPVKKKLQTRYSRGKRIKDEVTY